MRPSWDPSHGLLAQPSKRSLAILRGKMANLGLDEMFGNLWRDRENGAVRNRRDLGDEPVMVANKAQVRQKGGETVPPRKGLRLDHDTAQLSFFLDVGVNHSRDRFEITSLDRTLRPNQQDSFVA